MYGASRDRVSETLTRLQERYQSFDVNQTCVGVPTPVYEQVADAGHVDAHISVRNDDELLVRSCEHGDGFRTPNVQLDPEDDVGARVREAFEEATGVACTIDGLREVAIVAVYDQGDEDREPVYVLEAHFVGAYEAGSVRSTELSWSAAVEAVEPSY